MHFFPRGSTRRSAASFLGVACFAAGLVIAPGCSIVQAKKILYIDSYHEGYAWSEGITAGVMEVLNGTIHEVRVLRLDTKRNRSEEFKKTAALKAKEFIEKFKPDVVIAADDNAAKYLIMPYYLNTDLPVVFCGINWDASIYGLPSKNATGMIEVAPVPQLLDYLKRYSKGDRVGFLSPDLLSAHKEVDNYKKEFGIKLTEYYSRDADDWKKAFLELQNKVDMLIIDSDGGLYEDQADDIIAFVERNTKIPSGTILDFMAPYVFITFAKVAEEQGSWAAKTALEILRGTPPSHIPVERNKEGYLIINTRIAQALGYEIPYSILKSAYILIE
ncbi:MAG: hypothetical protein JW884_06435 [Deltaproteobacteria bacterium]|nr:hypothetical protein [Deltaproteobacteria bacterium]